MDLESKKLIGCHGELVLLPHDTSTCDEKMMAWIAQRSSKCVPIGNVLSAPRTGRIRGAELAKL